MRRWLPRVIPQNGKCLDVAVRCYTNKTFTRFICSKLEVVELFDAFEGIRLEEWAEVFCPVVGWHHYTPVLFSHQLCVVHLGGCLTNPGNIFQAAHLGPPESPLEEAKTPVRGKLGVTYNQEGELHFLVQSGQNTPRKVFQYIAIFILAGAVVRVQLQKALPKTVGLQVVMEHANDGISPLPGVYSLINEIVDLWEIASFNYFYT